MEVSSRSSEVVHAGLYYKTGSLRARLCVAGHRKLMDYCSHTGVGLRQVGKLIVATSEHERPLLHALAANAVANGVEGLTRISCADACRLEPELECVDALWSPATAIVDTHQLLLSLQSDFEDAGGTIAFKTAVTDITRDDAGAFVVTTRDASGDAARVTSDDAARVTMDDAARVTARRLVLAAGLGASALGTMLRYRDGYAVPSTYPVKGHYFALSGKVPFSRLIYPLPHGAWLGIHLTLDIAGRAKFGPDLAWCEKVDYAFEDEDGARRARFEREIRRYWPALPDGALQPGATGVRPKIYAEHEPVADFAIHGPRDHGVDGLVALYGIESPGLTSCLAIADYAADVLISN